MDLHGRSLLKETDLNAQEFLFLVDLAGRLREKKRRGVPGRRLAGRNIAPLAIASALLGGSLTLLARSMDDRAILRILENAAASVRAGELRQGEKGPTPGASR